MEAQVAFTVDSLFFALPDGWHEHTDGLNSGVKGFAITAQAGLAQLTVNAVDPAQAMPYGQDQAIVGIIHQQSLDDESGLIEVASTDNGAAHSVHSIFKRRVNDPSNPMLKLFYSASLFVHMASGKVYGFQFKAQEHSTLTSLRDSQILAEAQLHGSVTMAIDPATGRPKLQGWQQDPYDPNFTKGFLMNQSEKAEYDSIYPQHPLSLLRSAISDIENTVKE